MMKRLTAEEIAALPQTLKVADVQAIMGMSKDAAYQLVKAKGFPALRMERKYYIDKDAFMAWRQKNMCFMGAGE